jgi:galactose mutarotase-like enzyme
VDDGVALGQHGRVSGIPARVTRCDVVGDDLLIEGVIRQSSVFGENLVLRRRIRAAIGGTAIDLHDEVTNEGPQPSPHMMMYHANVGWPLVDETSVLEVPSSDIVPRDPIAASGRDRWNRFESPTADRRDEVSVHGFDSAGPVVAVMSNPRHGLRLEVGFDTRQLPWLCEWKFMRENTYVVGIEPVNSPATGGRAQARADGQLPMLHPGETVAYDIRFAASHLP